MGKRLTPPLPVMLLAAVLAVPLIVPVASAPDAGSSAQAAPPAPGPSRVAFTDATDRLVGVEAYQDFDDASDTASYVGGSSVPVIDSVGARHEGEMGMSRGPGSNEDVRSFAFVSTRTEPPGGEQDEGRVFFSWSYYDIEAEEDVERVMQVNPELTSDRDVGPSSHPVSYVYEADCAYSREASFEALVAFSWEVDGNTDIYVARLTASDFGCAELDVELVQITEDPARDLWPAWNSDGTGLVFSSTRDDRGGDLFFVPVDPTLGSLPTDPDDVVQLTDGAADETRPDVQPEPTDTCQADPISVTGAPIPPRWVVFTSTRFDDRGGLVALDLDDPGGGVVDLGVDAATEASWSPYGDALAWTSTAEDPDGDVLVGDFVRECPEADLDVSVFLIPASTADIGETVTASIRVTNFGPRATDATLTTSLGADAPDVEAEASWACDTGCELGRLRPFEQTTRTVDLTVLDGTVGGRANDITATVTGSLPDPRSGNDSSTAVLTAVQPSADLEVTSVVAQPDGITDGGSLEVMATVVNNGRRSASGTVVFDYDRPQLGCTDDFCNRSVSLAPGESTTVSIPLLAQSVDAEVSIAATVTIDSPLVDPDLTNNSGTTDVTLSTTPIALMAYGLVQSLADAIGQGLGLVTAPRAVPPPSKPPVDDRLGVQDEGVVLGEYDVAESHPTWLFSYGQNEGGAVGATVRPRRPGVADVGAEDAAGRRTLLDEAALAAFDPDYAPDGERMAFVQQVCPRGDEACTDRGLQIAQLDADGGPPSPLVNDRREDDVDRDPAFSPDGTMVAFSRTRSGQPLRIWVADLATGDATPVTDPHEPGDLPDPDDEFDQFDREPAWSPDSRTLVFSRGTAPVGFDGEAFEFPPPRDYELDLWTVDLGTGNEQVLVDDAGDDRHPDWSPDGDVIVYEHTGWLHRVRPDGTSRPPLTGPGTDTRHVIEWAQDPAYSPDGERVVFSGSPNGQPDLHGVYDLRSSSGEGLRTLSQQPAPETQPDWQPVADLAVTVTADPDLIGLGKRSRLAVEVENEGRGRALDATVTLILPGELQPGSLPPSCTAGPPITCDLGDLEAGSTLTRTVKVIGTTAGTWTAEASVTSDTRDSDPADNTDEADVQVDSRRVVPKADVSVRVTAAPVPAYLGEDVRVRFIVRNDGPRSSDVTLRGTAPKALGLDESEPCLSAPGCGLGQLDPGDRVVEELTGTPTRALTGAVRARVEGSNRDPVARNDTDRARVRVLEPTVELFPPLGTTGSVTTVTGTDFPPGSRVGLAWEPGIKHVDVPVRVRRDGTFDHGMVIVRLDQLGERELVVESLSGRAFLPLEAEYLVVPRTQGPPTFVGRG